MYLKNTFCDLTLVKETKLYRRRFWSPLLLLEEEERVLEDVYEKVKPYMRNEGIDVVENEGVAVYDSEGDLTTTLVNNKECSFVIFENGIVQMFYRKSL